MLFCPLAAPLTRLSPFYFRNILFWSFRALNGLYGGLFAVFSASINCSYTLDLLFLYEFQHFFAFFNSSFNFFNTLVFISYGLMLCLIFSQWSKQFSLSFLYAPHFLFSFTRLFLLSTIFFSFSYLL